MNTNTEGAVEAIITHGRRERPLTLVCRQAAATLIGYVPHIADGFKPTIIWAPVVRLDSGGHALVHYSGALHALGVEPGAAVVVSGEVERDSCVLGYRCHVGVPVPGDVNPWNKVTR